MTHDWSVWLDLDHPGYLPPQDHAARQRALQAAVADLDDDGVALLVTGAANIRWTTGFSGSSGALYVSPDEVVLLTDARYEGRAAVECGGLEVVVTRTFGEVAASRAAAADLGVLAFEGDHVSHRAGSALVDEAGEQGLASALPVHGLVERLRVVKDDAELARLARACAVTEAALDEVLSSPLAGRTERAVALAVEDAFRAREGAVGFPTIVAAGGSGAVPHHEPTGRVISEGELVTIDAGARIDGYHADTTRTVAAGPLPSGGDAELRDVFAAVAEAQQLGVAAAVAGVHAGAVDAACRDHLTAAGHGEHFLHGTGHGVGLEVHEAPAVAKGAAATLQPRTALTVEPGVYLPGRGGVRIEDTVVVTAEGPARRLTNSPRTLTSA